MSEWMNRFLSEPGRLLAHIPPGADVRAGDVVSLTRIGGEVTVRRRRPKPWWRRMPWAGEDEIVLDRYELPCEQCEQEEP